jgi:hypothetical protein
METALDKARARKDELKARGELVRLSPLERSQADPLSLRKAITAFCHCCMGGDGEPGARGHVRNCTSRKCPLYAVRPWQREDDE